MRHPALLAIAALLAVPAAASVVVDGTISNPACGGDTITIVESHGVGIAGDGELLERLANCEVHQIDYAYEVATETEAAAVEAAIDQALTRIVPWSACDDIVECAMKVAAKCTLMGLKGPKKVELLEYNKRGYEKQKCQGDCGSGDKTVVITCRRVWKAPPPPDVGR
jgi:hypothetical protein